jgi:hypothetical protein
MGRAERANRQQTAVLEDLALAALKHAETSLRKAEVWIGLVEAHFDMFNNRLSALQQYADRHGIDDPELDQVAAAFREGSTAARETLARLRAEHAAEQIAMNEWRAQLMAARGGGR